MSTIDNSKQKRPSLDEIFGMAPNNSMQTRPSLDEIFGDAPAAVDETQPLPATDPEIPESNVTSDYSQLPTSSFMSEEAQTKKAIDTNTPMVQNTIERNTTEQNARKEHFAKMANDEEYRENYLRQLGYKDSDDYRKKTADRLESVLNVIKSNIPDSRFVDYAVYEHSMPVRPMEETIATRQAKKVQEAINTLRSNNFWRGLAEGFDLNDIASLGFAQVGDNVMALNALNKARKGEELTQTEQSLVDAWKLGQQVEGEISMLGGRSLGANIGYGFGQSMPFVAEMIATGGVASAATKGISKAIAKRGIQEAAAEFVKAGSQKKIKEATSKQIVKGLEKAGLHLAESVVGGAARMPLVGGVYNNYTGKRLEQFALEDDKIKKYATPAWKDAMKAGFETWTEYFTEDIGKWMDAPLGKVGNSLAHSPFGKKIHLDRIADYKGNKFLTSLRDAAKVNGLPAEMAEEVMNDVLLNTFYNDKEGWREMASSDYWWQLAGVSALMQGAFVLPNMVSSGQRDYNNRVKELERIKKESLEAIKDPELKAKVAKAGAASSIVERSGILSTIDWKRKKFTKQDAFNAVKYINAQTEFDIAEGESAETERLSRFFDTAQFLGDAAYRGVDGKEDTGDIVQITDDKGNAYCVISGDIDSNNPDTILKARDIKGKVWDVPMYSVVKVDRNSISEGIAQAYAMMFNQQVNQEQLDALQTRISEAVAAGVSTNDVKDILRNNKIEVFEKGDVVRLNDGRLARVDGLNGDHYVVVTADESGAPNVESIGINDMPQTKALGNVVQEEATPEETAPEQPTETTPQSAPVNQAVEAVVVEAERAIDQRIDASANVADGNVYNCVLEDESEVVIRNGNVVLTENGEIDLAKSDQTVVVEYPDGRKRTVAPSQISHITNVENAEQAKDNAHAELREAVAQEVAAVETVAEAAEATPEGEAVAEEVAVTHEPTESVDTPTPETTTSVEVDTAAAPEAPELPRTKDGNVDYESIVDPEVYATSLEEELGTPDAALEAVETSIDGYAAEVTQLRDKAKKEKKISDRVALSKKADAIETYLGTLNEVRNILSKEVRVINGLAEALGLTVEYVDEVDGGRANAQILGNKVQIARYGRDLDKTIKFLIGHEFTHRLQDLSPEAYAQFKAAVIEHLDWRFEDEVKKLRKIYNRQGRYPATETLEDEVVADFAGQLATTTEVFDAFVESHPVSKWQQMWEKVLEVLQNIASYFTAEDVHQATLNNTIVKLSTLLESASAKVSEETDNQGKERYSIKEVNEAFNQQLGILTEDNKDKVNFSLGMPSAVLLSAGVPNKPMKLYGAKVIKKQKLHGFKLDELKNLPMAVADPIAVFDNYQREDNRSVLTELQTKDGNFLVSLNVGKNEEIDFNIVATIFGKGDEKIADWFEKGYATYINKEKALNYLHHSAPIAEALSDSRLNTITKIVQNFENPNIEPRNYLKEMDALYLDAVKRGDMETAQRMVEEAAEHAGYTTNMGYQGSLAFNGAAPAANAFFETKEERKQAWNNEEFEDTMSLGDYADNNIDTNDLEWRLTSRSNYNRATQYEKESIDNINRALKDSDHKITIYRAVPSGVIEGSVRNGDWVTPSRAYAEYHIGLQDWAEGRVIKQEVDIDNLWWDGNDINEWGYDDGSEYTYKNTKNNRKLLDAVTYDDNGNVIPLSERFNPREEDVRYSVKTAPVFYSNAENAVRNIKQEKATPEQWLKMIEKNGGLKAGEDKWLGLSDWLKASDKKTLTKAEVMEYIRENQIQIEEVKYREFGPGLIDEAANILTRELQTIGIDGLREKYPDFENYFEVDGNEVLWSENMASEGEYEDYIIEHQITNVNPIDNAINERRLSYTTRGLRNKQEIALVVPTIESWNASDEVHFGDAGNGRAIAWVRFGETTDADGNRVLVIDEVQSKRHQEGRERGYGTDVTKQEVDKAREELDVVFRMIESYEAQMTEKYGNAYWTGQATEDEVNHWELLRSEFGRLQDTYEDLADKFRKSIPAAPFEKNWAELAMKRMLRYAAENGFDKIAWTTGEQQAERYNLGAVMTGLKAYKTYSGEYYVMPYNNGAIGEFTKEYSEKELADTFGKELAADIIANAENATEDNPYEIEGEELRFGGSGMKTFYDTMLVNFMNKYGKKWGVKVGEVTMPELEQNNTMHSVDVTDAMRESVMQGQPMFSIKDVPSLVGIHNLSLEKLRKVIRMGGSLANPSVAVLDIDKSDHSDYGDYSLILPKDLVDARLGKNAGTWAGDAWTPTYPTVVKKIKKTSDISRFYKDINKMPSQISSKVSLDFNSYLEGRSANALYYWYLFEKGEAPELREIPSKFPAEIRDALERITNGSFSMFGLTPEQRAECVDVYVAYRYDGDRAKYEENLQHILEVSQKLVDSKNGLVARKAQQDLESIKEYGFDYDRIARFIRDVEYDVRHSGQVDTDATIRAAQEQVQQNGLEGDFAKWKESLDSRYGIEEFIFDGYTPSGSQKWLPHTTENASKWMKKQGRVAATGTFPSFGMFIATVIPRMTSLESIRKRKKQLGNSQEVYDAFKEKWEDTYYNLGKKLQPDAHTFEDYGWWRLMEAAAKPNPQKYIKEQYNIDFSDEDMATLNTLLDAIKKEYPAKYFETKFERPVALREFSAAVVPDTIPVPVEEYLRSANLNVYKYDKSVEGSQREATLKAVDSPNVRFSIKSTPADSVMDYNRGEYEKLTAEYNELLQNKEKNPNFESALNEWRDRKAKVLYDYLYAFADNLGISQYVVIDVFNTRGVREEYGPVVDLWMPGITEEDRQKALDRLSNPKVRGIFIPQNGVLIDVSHSDNFELNIYEETLIHEFSHYDDYHTQSEDSLVNLYEENKEFIEGFKDLSVYVERGDSEDVLATELLSAAVERIYRRGALTALIDGLMTAEEAVDTLKYSKPLMREILIEKLNRYKDYAEQAAERWRAAGASDVYSNKSGWNDERGIYISEGSGRRSVVEDGEEFVEVDIQDLIDRGEDFEIILPDNARFSIKKVEPSVRTLPTAEQMESELKEAGVAPEEIAKRIKEETGWYRNDKGHWSYKISKNPSWNDNVAPIDVVARDLQEIDNAPVIVDADLSDEEKNIIDAAKTNGTYLKAPNGATSNLPLRQWAMVRTAAFKEQFGDWENNPESSSKAVDENGEPQLVYFKDVNEFAAFGLGEEGASREKGAFGQGIYATPYSSHYRESYGQRTRRTPLFLNMRNPLVLDAQKAEAVKKDFWDNGNWSEESSEKFTQWLKANGYDAVVYENKGVAIDVVYSPDQVISAHGESILNLAAKRIQDLSKSMSRLYSKLRDSKDVAHEVAMEIKNTISKDLIDIIGKRDFNSFITILDSSVGNRDKAIAMRQLRERVVSISGKALLKHFNKMMGINLEKLNPRGVSMIRWIDGEGRLTIKTFKDAIANGITAEKLREEFVEEWKGGQGKNFRDPNSIFAAIEMKERYEEYQSKVIDIEDIVTRISELRDVNSKLFQDAKELEYDKARRQRSKIAKNKKEIDALLAQRVNFEDDRNKALLNLNSAFDKIMRNGRLAMAERKMQDAIHNYKIADMAMKDCADENNPTRMRDDKLSVGKKIALDVHGLLFNPAYSMNTTLRIISVNAPSGEGRFYHYFADRYLKAQANFYAGYNSALDEYTKKAKDIFGKDFAKALKDSAADSDIIITRTKEGSDEEEENQLTYGEAMYLYMVNKMVDGQVKLRRMGISEERMNQLTEDLPVQYRYFADWIQAEFLPKLREKYNQTYIKKFGIPMPEIENYCPLKIQTSENYQEFDGSGADGTYLPTAITGSVIARKNNTKPIDVNSNALEVIRQHFEDMEHWDAYTFVVSDMNTLLSNTAFRRMLDQQHPGMHNRLKELSQIAAGKYRAEASETEIAYGKLNKVVATSKISFRQFTALKQLLSYPAFISYSSNPKFLAKLAIQPIFASGNFKWAMENSQIFKARWESRSAGNEKLANVTALEWSKFVQGTAKWGMFSNAGIDALVCATGAKAIYDFELSRLIKSGMSEKYAHSIALNKAIFAVNETQQSSEPIFLSKIQVGKDLGRVAISTFMNSNFSYLRKTIEAFVQLTKRNRDTQIANRISYYKGQGSFTDDEITKLAEKDVKNANRKAVWDLFIFGSMLNILWDFGGYVFLYAFGDDDDRDEIYDMMGVSALLAPLRNLPLGNLITNLVYGFSTAPMALNEVQETIKQIRGWWDDDPNTYNETALYIALRAVSTFGIGVDLNTFANIYQGVAGMIRDGYDVEDLMNILNAPQSQARLLAGKPKAGETLDEYMARMAFVHKRLKSKVDKKDLSRWERDYIAGQQRKLLVENDYSSTDYAEYTKQANAIRQEMGVTRSGKLNEDARYDFKHSDATEKAFTKEVMRYTRKINALQKQLDKMVVFDDAYLKKMLQIQNLRKELIEKYEQHND